jgi:hypothetical protein
MDDMSRAIQLKKLLIEKGVGVIIAISTKKLKQTNPDISFWPDPEPSFGYFTNEPIPPDAFEWVVGKDPKTGKKTKLKIKNGKLVKS